MLVLLVSDINLNVNGSLIYFIFKVKPVSSVRGPEEHYRTAILFALISGALI